MNIRRILLPAIVLSLLLSCCRTENTPSLKTGDLVFVGFSKSEPDSTMSSAIAAATGPEDSLEIVHVAIVECSGDSVFVIDATIRRGVHRHPLDTMISDFTRHDGTKLTLVFKRLKDNSSASGFVQNAKEYIGLPYDLHFMPSNQAYYCSELVRDSYRNGDEYIFEEKPMNFKAPDGTFPEYWTRLFGKLGVPVPQDTPGTNPRDMMLSPALCGTGFAIQ